MKNCIEGRTPTDEIQSKYLNLRFCQDPGLNRKAKEIIRFCLDSVMKLYGWDDILAIILTGSFARGEGSIVKSPENVFYVLGDVEYMVVLPSQKGFVAKYRKLKEMSIHISHGLMQRGIHCEVDLTPVLSDYFANAKPVIFNVELKRNGKIIYGDEDFCTMMPDYDVTDIPRDDAFNLLSNRIVEQLILYQYIVNNPDINYLQALYQVTKLYLDLGGSLLAFSGNYGTTYSKRVLMLERLSSAPDKGRRFAGIDIDRLYRSVRECTDVKLTPKYEDFFPDAMSHEEMKKYLLARIRTAVHDVRKLWMWEVRGLYSLGACTDFQSVLDKIGMSDHLLQRIKGWTKLVFLHCKYKKKFSLTRIIKLFSSGTPRALLNMAAAQTFFSLGGEEFVHDSEGRELQMKVRSIIPVLYSDNGSIEEGLLQGNMINIIRNWENYIKNF